VAFERADFGHKWTEGDIGKKRMARKGQHSRVAMSKRTAIDLKGLEESIKPIEP